MKHNNDHIDERLRNLDKEIRWNPRRQQRVRRRIIDKMNGNKSPFHTLFKRRLIPVFSVLLVATIVTTLALSEFTGQEMAEQHDSSGGNDNDPSHAVTGEEQQDDSRKDDDDGAIPPDQTDEQGAPSSNNTTDNEVSDSKKESKPPEEPSDTDPAEPEDTGSEERTLTQKEILHAVKGQMNTDLNILLPQELPLHDGYHLTATTRANATSYEVTFYEHTEPIPINNKLLFSDENPAQVIARLTVDKHDKQEKADQDIAHEDFSESRTETVNLGYNTTGYQDGAAGSFFTSWNVGRWALSVKTSTQHTENGETYAKKTVKFLTEKALPIPKSHGFAHLDPDTGDTRIKWQKGKTVYTIDHTNDPDIALKVAVQFK